jgi:hypothetical protein
VPYAKALAPLGGGKKIPAPAAAALQAMAPPGAAPAGAAYSKALSPKAAAPPAPTPASPYAAAMGAGIPAMAGLANPFKGQY